MKHRGRGRTIALVLLLAGLGALQQVSAQKSGGGTTGGGSTGGTSGGSGGTTTGRPTTTTAPSTTNPSQSTQSNPSNNRPIFLSGRVLTQDGSAPPERVSIERVCAGSTTREAYTDSKGYFSFEVGANAGILGDASMDTPLFGNGGSNNNGSSQGLGGNSQTGLNALWGCELRAALAGYHSDSLSLANRRSMDNPDVGTIYLTRMMKVDGYTTSATIALAPKEARKAYEKGLNFSKHLKPDEAQAEFLLAVKIYPKHAAAWFELGKVYEQRNHIDEARDAYHKATLADVNYVNPYERLYLLAVHDTQWKEAADLSEKVLHLNPYEFSGAYYINAVANAQLRNWEAAEKSAREAADVKGTHAMPKSLYLLAMILANKGDFSGSIENLHSYLKTELPAADRDRTVKMLAQIEQQLQAKQQTPAAQTAQ